MDWYVYILRCVDDTLYTGITTCLERRVDEHNSSSRGARYTRSRRPVELIVAWRFADRSTASSAEHAFKALGRPAKLKVIAGTCEPPPSFESGIRLSDE